MHVSLSIVIVGAITMYAWCRLDQGYSISHFAWTLPLFVFHFYSNFLFPPSLPLPPPSPVSGMGFGVIAGVVAFANVLRESGGPAVVGIKGSGSQFFVLSSGEQLEAHHYWAAACTYRWH